MKQFFSICTLFFALQATAQHPPYQQTMETHIAALDATHGTEGLLQLSEAFTRIGDSEKTKWLPYYYAALCLSNAGWADAELDKDANAGKIMSLCDKAAALHDNAEIYAIRYMAATQQLLVDPQNRWGIYGAEAEKYMKQGQELEPGNPRLLFLQAAALFGTPEAFGGGKAKARPILEKAITAFDRSQPEKLHPSWGREQAMQMLEQTK